MQRLMMKLRPLAYGGVSLGWLSSLQDLDFNQMWYSLLATLLNAFVSLLFGVNIDTATGTTTSIFESLFA